MSDCLFCKICEGKIPAIITYRDEEVVAFKDIGPKAPLHELVISVRHIASLQARAAGFADSGFRVVMNAGPDAGQTVHHVHLHVLAGRPLGWPPG